MLTRRVRRAPELERLLHLRLLDEVQQFGAQPRPVGADLEHHTLHGGFHARAQQRFSGALDGAHQPQPDQRQRQHCAAEDDQQEPGAEG